MTDPENHMLTAALSWASAGCSVIPVAADGTKTPLVAWKTHQHTPADTGTLTDWFADGHPGLGIVCGAVSGHLEMFELEGRAVAEELIPRLAAACDAAGIGGLWATVAHGCAVMSPSGGVHLYYRVFGGVDGNTKLAQRRARDDEYTDDERRRLADRGVQARRVLIETRGEGGYVVAAPSHGAVHDSGHAWRWVTGGPGTIPTITAEQRDALHIVARDFDQLPPPAPIPEPAVLDTDRTTGGVAPGADYNQRGSWADLLCAHGWTPVARGSHGGRQYWTRPGKTRGVSAVTGGGETDYFWCWSSSTELPAEQAMSKWRVYALLEHGGDFHAAAKALRARGFGQAPPPPTRPVFTVLNPADAVDGTAARQPEPACEPPPVTLAATDDGNALALVDRFGAVIRYCADRGRWLHWTGHRWQWCSASGGPVREYAKQVARGLPERDTTELRHKTRSLGAKGTSDMLLQASTDRRVTVTLDDLDASPLELNTPAGIVDLRTGAVHPPDPARLHTRITAVSPDPDADPARWSAFLADTFAGHDEIPPYLQRLVGYSATGVIHDHVLPFAFGGGANGKGVFLETIRTVLGDYATTAPSGFLMARAYPAHETEIARLAGARMVVCSEINEDDRFDEAKVKALTGGDALTARFMRADHFTFAPTHKLWLMGNHQPTVNGGGHSFWRRLRIVPFLNTVPEERRVDDLQGILAREHGPAVLAWIIAGAVSYFHDGLREPDAVRVATDEYAQDQDTVSRFVDECCHLGAGTQVKIRINVLRDAYERWCHAEGVTPVRPRRLGMILHNRFGVAAYRTNAARFYQGITLFADEDDDPRAGG